MRSKLSLVAEAISIDRETNEVSVFNLIDRLGMAGFPTVIRRLAFLVVLEREDHDAPGEFNVTLTVRLTDNSTIATEHTFSFANEPSIRALFRANGLPVTGPGAMHFSLTQDANVIATYNVGILQATPAQLQAIGAPPPARPNN